ncbi:type II toxin-antitoxin system death-on-curing family toxin [bacterium]|nr:type II toxin-antitoxin system death-on-curing family toxin [bacterium]|tara:strand:- start:276 stop:650 length:375 start_codon:yes stop_codon:yes gene_type:complete
MWFLLTAQDVIDLHDEVLNPGELVGLAKDKSIEAAIGRVDWRINYGAVNDEFDLAAAYVVAIAQAHAFNDANKRTAFAALDTLLAGNGIVVTWQVKEVGDIIIDVAQGNVDEDQLARWLREHVV